MKDSLARNFSLTFLLASGSLAGYLQIQLKTKHDIWSLALLNHLCLCP